jgi:hypothetical protein
MSYYLPDHDATQGGHWRIGERRSGATHREQKGEVGWLIVDLAIEKGEVGWCTVERREVEEQGTRMGMGGVVDRQR